MRDTEGLIQITAMPSFLKPRANLSQANVSDFIDHLDYVVRRIGVAHVGISSDFDGGGAIGGWGNASESLAITAELARRGYGHSEIACFWGGNFLRLLRHAERVSQIAPASLPENETGSPGRAQSDGAADFVHQQD